MQLNHSTPERVAVYARVSSDEQAQAGTIKTQVDFLTKHTDLHQLPAAGSYCDDGISGTTLFAERPEGRRLLDDARAGIFNAVICYRLDRLSRSLRGLLDVHEQLDALGIAIKSATEPVDTSSPIGRFIFQLLGSFAELELSTIKDRTTQGRDRHIRDGKHVGGAPPYGYIRGIDGTLTPSLELASPLDLSVSDVVRDIFRRITSGAAAEAEARRLNALGVLSPRQHKAVLRGRENGNGHAPALWYPTQIAGMIRNPVYRGEVTFRSMHGDITTAVPPLVDEVTWHRAGEQLTRNKKQPKGKGANSYLLHGLIRCANCGYVYAGMQMPSGGRQVPIYRCSSAASGGKRTTVTPTGEHGRCIGKSVHAAWLEEMIWSAVASFIHNPDSYLHEAQAQLRTRLAASTDADTRAASVRADLAGKQSERDRIIHLVKKGLIQMGEGEEQLDQINRETATLRAGLDSLTNHADLLAAGEEHLAATAAMLPRLQQEVDEIEAMPEGVEKQERKRGHIERFVLGIRLHTDLDPTATRGKALTVAVRYVFQPQPLAAFFADPTDENCTTLQDRSGYCVISSKGAPVSARKIATTRVPTITLPPPTAISRSAFTARAAAVAACTAG